MLNLSSNNELIFASYEKLLSSNLVSITKMIAPMQDGGSTFNCKIKVPFPNSANIPEEIELIVEIPSEYPYDQVKIRVENSNLIGFPHQNTNNGELCLIPQDFAQINEDRLICYIKWAKNWFEDAANNNLLKHGATYEIPHFKREYNDLLLFQEDINSFNIWNRKINSIGSCSFFVDKRGFIFPLYFSSNSNQILLSYRWNKFYKKNNKEFKATWIILNDIRYFRHRPPKTYQELFDVLEKNGFNRKKVFERLLKNVRFLKYEPLVLIGFPISEKIGDSNNQIYWVSFKFKNKSEIKRIQSELGLNTKKKRRIYRYAEELLPIFNFDDPIGWMNEENCSTERLFSRSAFNAEFRKKKIFLIGCGSLGSHLADLLVRGGVKNIVLCDGDVIELGNLCRHNLSGDSLHQNKAEELCKKMSLVNPRCEIKTYTDLIPNKNEKFKEDILNSDLIIDCTSDYDGFLWLSHFCKQHNKILCSASFNSKASYLTVAISSTKRDCSIIKKKIWDKVKNNETPFDPDDYLKKMDKNLFIQNAGCYHPTFPAVYYDIQSLVNLQIFSKQPAKASGIKVCRFKKNRSAN